jgi:hypothetical protein
VVQGLLRRKTLVGVDDEERVDEIDGCNTPDTKTTNEEKKGSVPR